jgi:pimeloyl-ACP methyl ester carboxylesterase
MYYEEQGPADAQPLVLLHGGGGTIDDPVGGWAGLAPLFAESFRTVLVEHRGHGRTANPDGLMTFEQMGDDIAGLIEQLELVPAHVAGISDGGVMALDLGLRQPALVRAITIIGANYCVDESTLAMVESLDPDAIERAAPQAAADFANRHDVGKYPGFWKDLIRQVRENNRVNPSWTEADLRRFDRPILVIAGENDPFANTDQMVVMKREIPAAEWLILNHAGHAVHFEHPEIVGPRMVDFHTRHS